MTADDARRDPFGRSQHGTYRDRCRRPACDLGCTELPSPAVYARAAVLAAEYAARYRARGRPWAAARAERAAWQLAEVAEYGHEIPA
jgi:hypothetical protein